MPRRSARTAARAKLEGESVAANESHRGLTASPSTVKVAASTPRNSLGTVASSTKHVHRQSLPVLPFSDSDAFAAYLAAQPKSSSPSSSSASPGVWLKIAKKSSGVPSVSYDEAVDVALCHGWIDGQRKSFDTAYFIQRFTPRRKNSLWSRRNVDKVAVLTAAGRIQPTGQAEVDAARADGRWEKAYSAASIMAMPDDFQAALKNNSVAENAFQQLGKTQKYPFLWRLETAKKPETRERKIKEFVQLLAEGKTL